jgi:prepilin-type N-terminal cleavage/methylation domain-containing protein
MRGNSGQPWSAGFTLMEVIVSLAVIAVAATIGVSMFGHSYALGKDVRDRRVAQRLAEEILTEMQRDPASFAWPAANDQLQPVPRTDGQSQALPPGVPATYPGANRVIQDQYGNLQWRAYVRLSAGAKTCELTAVVSWVRSGRARALTLTALAPLRVLEGKP